MFKKQLNTTKNIDVSLKNTKVTHIYAHTDT